jgi:hypothetical protein
MDRQICRRQLLELLKQAGGKADLASSANNVVQLADYLGPTE